MYALSKITLSHITRELVATRHLYSYLPALQLLLELTISFLNSSTNDAFKLMLGPHFIDVQGVALGTEDNGVK
jgi:hypothetical protein